MKTYIVVAFLTMLLLVSVGPVIAAPSEQKSISPIAFEHANDEFIFYRISDWFATLGKSDQEKKIIIAERRMKRAAARALKQAKKIKKGLEAEVEREKNLWRLKMEERKQRRLGN